MFCVSTNQKISRGKTLHGVHVETAGSVDKSPIDQAAHRISPAQPAPSRAQLERPLGASSEAAAHLDVLGPAASSTLAQKRARNFWALHSLSAWFCQQDTKFVGAVWGFFSSSPNIRRYFLKQTLTVSRSNVKSASHIDGIGLCYK